VVVVVVVDPLVVFVVNLKSVPSRRPLIMASALLSEPASVVYRSASLSAGTLATEMVVEVVVVLDVVGEVVVVLVVCDSAAIGNTRNAALTSSAICFFKTHLHRT